MQRQVTALARENETQSRIIASMSDSRMLEHLSALDTKVVGLLSTLVRSQHTERILKRNSVKLQALLTEKDECITQLTKLNISLKEDLHDHEMSYDAQSDRCAQLEMENERLEDEIGHL